MTNTSFVSYFITFLEVVEISRLVNISERYKCYDGILFPFSENSIGWKLQL